MNATAPSQRYTDGAGTATLRTAQAGVWAGPPAAWLVVSVKDGCLRDASCRTRIDGLERDVARNQIVRPGQWVESHFVCRVGFCVMDLRTLGLPWLRHYRSIPSGWRLRRLVTRYAQVLSVCPLSRWRGQTLCCAARKEAPSERSYARSD